jgi:hypothetical protein
MDESIPAFPIVIESLPINPPKKLRAKWTVDMQQEKGNPFRRTVLGTRWFRNRDA